MKPTSSTAARLWWLAAGLPLAVLSASGQPAASPSAASNKQDEVVTLSPFVVEDNSEEGYYSPEAVSGTRTRTELINLPMNLTVFNENFINDIGARDLVDIVSFASGVGGGATAGSDLQNGDTLGFILRGQGGFVPNRNGFRRLRLVDPVTISRVEVLKGPSSVLYGQASPGGSVNYITKRPVRRKLANASITVGSYDFYRGTVDVNIPSPNKNLAFRFVGSIEDSESWIARQHKTQTVLYPSMTWWIRPETTLTVEYESTKSREKPGSSIPYHPFLDPQRGMLGAVDETFNFRGPHDFKDVTMGALTIEFIHKFNDNLTLRANWSDVSWEDDVRYNNPSTVISSIAGGAPTNPPLLQGRGYSRGIRGSWDKYRQVELLNNFEYGGVKVQNLFGYQLGQEKFVQVYAEIAPPRDTVFWNLEDPSTWILSEHLTGAGTAGTTGSHARNTINSGYFVNQLTFFDDKIHTLAGVRVDKIRSDTYWDASTANPAQSYAEYPTKTSPQVGVLYKPIEGLSFFASYSTSIVNLYTTTGRRPDGTYFNPVPGTGKGYDVGVKTDMFKGKLSGVVSIYSLEEADIVRFLPSVTVNGETFTPIAQSGVNSSSGVELDLNYRPTRRTQIGLGYAYNYSYVKSDEGTSTTLNGVRYLTRENQGLAYAPHHTLSGNFRHDFGALGKFDNVYLVGNGRWVDERRQTDALSVLNNTLAHPWMLDDYLVLSAGFGGTFDVGRTKYTASFLVKNLADKRYLASRNFYGAPRTYEFTLRMQF
jgi:iron complex outermembrane receptor protein